MSFTFLEDIAADLRQAGIAGRTEIQTPHGSTPIRDLEPGDMVMTDIGFQPVLDVECQDARSDIVSQPVRVADHPHRDDFGLQVAPYQIVRVQDQRAASLFGDGDIGVEARFLIGWRGVRAVQHTITQYYTLRFAAPRIVWAVGGMFLCATRLADGTPTRVLTPAEAREWRSWAGGSMLLSASAAIATPAAGGAL